MAPSKQRIRRTATRADSRIALAKRLSRIHADLAALKRDHTKHLYRRRVIGCLRQHGSGSAFGVVEPPAAQVLHGRIDRCCRWIAHLRQA